MKKIITLAILSVFLITLGNVYAKENCEQVATVFTDGKGNNRTKKLGGNYCAISMDKLNAASTIKISPVYGTFKYVTLHARYKGGYWKTIYKGPNKEFPFDQYIASYKKDANCTHVNVSVNGAHEKYEPIACTSDVLVCNKETAAADTGCAKVSAVYTTGKGDNRTKKLGGTYTAIDINQLSSNQTIKITPLSGTYKYITLHSRFSGGYWKTIYKGPEKEFSVAKYIDPLRKDSKFTHVNISVNGAHEKYEPIACTVDVSVCGSSEPVQTDTGCKKLGSVFTDGKGNRRTKKLGGNYAAIDINQLDDNKILKVNTTNGTAQYVTLHARYAGGYWRTVYKGPIMTFPVAQYITSYKKDKKCTHIIVSINGGHEKYDPVVGKADILLCGGGSTASVPSSSVTNLALGKPTKQSSTAFNGEAKRAVDGNTDGQWERNSTTHTNHQKNAWWEVDLRSKKTIKFIKIYNRDDCCMDRLNNCRVIVSPKPLPNRPLSDQEILPLYSWEISNASDVNRINTKNVEGRFIRIQLKNTNYLSLAEVEVFGK